MLSCPPRSRGPHLLTAVTWWTTQALLAPSPLTSITQLALVSVLSALKCTHDLSRYILCCSCSHFQSARASVRGARSYLLSDAGREHLLKFCIWGGFICSPCSHPDVQGIRTHESGKTPTPGGYFLEYAALTTLPCFFIDNNPLNGGPLAPKLRGIRIIWHSQ